jgi:hypothetical protein
VILFVLSISIKITGPHIPQEQFLSHFGNDRLIILIVDPVEPFPLGENVKLILLIKAQHVFIILI